MMKSTEFLEMLIGMAGLLYVSLHWKLHVKIKTATQTQV